MRPTPLWTRNRSRSGPRCRAGSTFVRRRWLCLRRPGTASWSTRDRSLRLPLMRKKAAHLKTRMTMRSASRICLPISIRLWPSGARRAVVAVARATKTSRSSPWLPPWSPSRRRRRRVSSVTTSSGRRRPRISTSMSLWPTWPE